MGRRNVLELDRLERGNEFRKLFGARGDAAEKEEASG